MYATGSLIKIFIAMAWKMLGGQKHIQVLERGHEFGSCTHIRGLTTITPVSEI